MPQRGTLDVIASSLATLLKPLEDRLAAGEVRFLLAELGLQFPPALETNAAFVNATKAVTQRGRDLPAIVAALANAIDDEDIPQIVAKALDLGNAVRTVIQESENLANALKTQGAGMGIPAGELNQFANELPGRLVDYLVVKRLETVPGTAEALEFIGAVERSEVPGVDPAHPVFIRRQLHVDQLTAFVQDPAAHLAGKYQWGSPGFDGTVLLQTVQRLLTGAGVPAVLDTSGPVPVLDALFLEMRPKTDVNPRGLSIRIAERVNIDNAAPFVDDDWQFRLVTNASLAVGAEVVLQANDKVTFVPAGGAKAEGDVMLEWTGGKADGDPYLIVGEPGGSRLEAGQFVARAGVGLAWNSGAGRGEGTFKVAGEVKRGKLVISLANADGFIGTILSGFGLESDFDLGVGYSTKEGVFFAGAATLEIQLPLHVQLGPVELTALTLTVGIENQKFPIGFRTNIKAALGPLQAVVEQIGAGVDISLPADRKGNAGPLDLAFRFLPPKGIGLSLDAGVVKGGGYLFIDVDRGEYAGALELSFTGIVTITAIGIITTRMPDGSSGFSLLIIMSVEFGTGIQLGFGFTLLAVGGLIGLNRTMNLQALVDGIRTNAITSVMFPKDIIANAPKIISDLRAFFPPQQGTFLIGPMVKLGWGTPTLVSVALGIIIEIPGNIAIVGVIKIAIPADEIAIIVLQVNFIGAIEFDKKRIYFFAALFESRVVFLTIEGEMGLLVAFGDDANFVVSVGGFHPRFSPPPLPFPAPKRIAISLLNTPVARVRIEGYFAVTSNTVQFGARVEVFFGLDIANVQGHLAFDALFQFSPFFFIIEISASFSVKIFGAGLFSIGFRGALKGPSPWNIKGHGSISILFWDVDIEFEETWGESRDTELPPIAVMGLFEAEINKAESWRAILPASNNLQVSLRKMPAEDAASILHPLGVLRVSQRALPLELKLDKVGTRKPSDVNRVALSVVGGLTKTADAFERFAPAQFQNFSDADKLSKPAFAQEKSGVDLSASGADVRSSRMVKRVVRYEEIIIDSNYKRFARRFRGFIGSLFNFFLNGAAVTHCELSQAVKTKMQPFADKVAVGAETYTVAFQADNKAVAGDAAAFHSEASAREYLSARLAADPSLADTMHVIPSYEKAA